ncbi:NmrA family transcriptional regulator [Novosphingobium endophyticum]|uniref:NmrA family transcriptional regulator n=1 Tax=Novosphingobium endophyticum TaxID=1955250 RepID=A0A916X5M8_9SPHN|nr:NmrA family transcriptional regulator [Novosphingobium endophyticum]
MGDLEAPDTLAAALEGAHGVFSVQRPDLTGTNSERRHGFALVDAALDAGVSHFVHSSVCQVEDHEAFPRWDEGYWSVSYWTDKWAVEQKVRDAGFPCWTVMRPSFIMENLTDAKARYLYPQLRDGLLLTPIRPESKVQLIAGDDIGAFVHAAFEDPQTFCGKAIELAGDEMTVADIAETLQTVLEVPVRSRSVSAQEALSAGLAATWVRSQEWVNDVGYHVDRTRLDDYRIPLTTLRDWAERHRDLITIRNPEGSQA